MTRLTVLSFGGGQDSTLILLKLIYNKAYRKRYAPGKLLVLMADTGDEHPATYEHVIRMQALCLENLIEFHVIRPEMGCHSESAPNLRDFWRKTNSVGSKAFPKSCTDRLKIRPIYKYLERLLVHRFGVSNAGKKKGIINYAEKHGKIDVLIGFAKDERKRISKGSSLPKWMQKSIRRRFPLIDGKLDRAGCQKEIIKLGHIVPPPSNCILCPYMNDVELLWLYRFMPDDYKDWVKIEKNKLEANRHKFDQNFGVWGVKTLPQKLKEVIEKHGHMTNEELQEYKMSHGHCVKSKY